MPRRRPWFVAALVLAAGLGSVGLLLRPDPDGDAATPWSGEPGDERGGPALRCLAARNAPPDPPALGGHPSDEPRAPASGRAAPPVRVVVSGLVYDGATREPLAGVAVTVRGGEETPAGSASAVATTDARGVYRLVLSRPVCWYERLGFARAGYVATGCDRFTDGPRTGGRIPPVRMDPVRARLPGRVLDWQGRPVAGAHVRVEKSGTWFRSDARGRFGPVPVGGRQIQWLAWAEGHARTKDHLDLEPTLPDELLVRLLPHGFLRGVVVDEAGAPVAGAEIHRRGLPGERRVRADARGRFRWPLSFDHGAYLVAVAGRRAGLTWGRAELPLRIVVRPMEQGAWRWTYAPRNGPIPPPPPEVASRTRVTVRVRAVDAGGRALAWADVRISCRGWQQLEWTDAAGRCVLRVPAGLPLRLDVSHHAAADARRTESFAAGRVHDLRVALPPRPPPRASTWIQEEEPPPATTIDGVVLDAKGRPFPGVWIKAPPWGEDASDRWGRWRLANGAAGATVPLLVSADGYPALEATGTFGGPRVVVRLPARSAVRVRLDGTAAEDACPRVRVLVPRDPDQDLLLGESECVFDDGDGFRVDCPVGIWTVAFRLEPGHWAVFPDVRVVPGKETVLTYDFPRLGHLRVWAGSAAGGGVPDPCVWVAATNAEIGTGDETGTFETDVEPWDADEVPAGVAHLRVEAEEHAPAFTRPVDLRRDEVVRVVLERGVRVTGVVRDAAGRPVVASIAWVAPHGPLLYPTTSDADGTFELEGWLPTGRTRLHVHRDGRAPFDATIDVPAGREEVTVELRMPAGTARTTR